MAHSVVVYGYSWRERVRESWKLLALWAASIAVCLLIAALVAAGLNPLWLVALVVLVPLAWELWTQLRR